MTTRNYKATKYSGDNPSEISDSLTVEEAIQIKINDHPYTVTMRTPGNVKELVRGLLYTEQIYQENFSPVIEVEKVNDTGAVLVVNVKLDEATLGPGYLTERNILSVSSCGICGKRELNDLTVQGKALETETKLGIQSVSAMIKTMEDQQKTFQRSGGSHASAAFDSEGHLLTVMEDIGRHNAVDKVVGSLLEMDKLEDAVCLLVSGRISYEIVTKAFITRIPFLASVSAASSLAVDYADQLGITLIAFCRGDNATVYCNGGRIMMNV